MFRCPHIKGTGVEIPFHDAELVLDLCQSMVFINHILCIHGQFGSDDLVIAKAFSVFRYFIEIHKTSYFGGIQYFTCFFIDTFFLKKLTQGFRLDCCDPKILRMFLQFL